MVKPVSTCKERKFEHACAHWDVHIVEFHHLLKSMNIIICYADVTDFPLNSNKALVCINVDDSA